MRVTVNHEQKRMQVWCTQDERDSEGFLDRLPQIAGYKTVIFISGTQSLAALTADLLRHNLFCDTAPSKQVQIHDRTA